VCSPLSENAWIDRCGPLLKSFLLIGQVQYEVNYLYFSDGTMGVLPAGIMVVQAEYLYNLVALSYDKPPGSVAGFEIIAHAHNMTKSRPKIKPCSD